LSPNIYALYITLRCYAGRSFAVIPRTIAAIGHIDLDANDYEEGSLLDKLQTESGGSQSKSLVRS